MSEEQYHVKDSDIDGFFVFLSVTLTDFQTHIVCSRTASFEGGHSSWDHDDILFLELDEVKAGDNSSNKVHSSETSCKKSPVSPSSSNCSERRR